MLGQAGIREKSIGMKHFLIYTNFHKDVQGEVTDKITEYLKRKGQRVTQVTGPAGTVMPAEEIPADAFCMLVLGGDGTMLRAARDTKHVDIPLIGVNLGTLGYMTEIEPTGMEEALDKLMANEFQMVSRMMLDGTVYSEDGLVRRERALNDIVISRSGSLQINKVRVYVNGKFLKDYDADGIIVTTPTGSTGYNLSAGGPIVDPKAELIMLTPVCPHTLNARSIIFSSEDMVEIEILAGKEGQPQKMEVSFDGANIIPMKTGDRVQILKSEKTTEIIHINQVNFLEVLHEKMRDI